MAKYSTSQLLPAMVRRAKEASSVAGEIHQNIKHGPETYKTGMGRRLVRGGFGDAALNTDRPEPRMIQKQMGMVQRAAAADNLTAASAVAGAPKAVGAGARFIATQGPMKDRVTGKFVSPKMFKRLLKK